MYVCSTTLQKPLLTVKIPYIYCQSADGRRKVTHKSETLICPYIKCRKIIQKPLVLIDSLKTPRETYYACPHCHSPLDIIVKNGKGLNSVSVEASKSAKEVAPAGCPHHLGYLQTLAQNAPFPDECLTCSALLKCVCKK